MKIQYEFEQTVSTYKRMMPINPESFEEAKAGNRASKLELVSNILSIRARTGIQNTGEHFNELFDMPLSRLHNELIQAQDQAYEFK